MTKDELLLKLRTKLQYGGVTPYIFRNEEFEVDLDSVIQSEIEARMEKATKCFCEEYKYLLSPKRIINIYNWFKFKLLNPET